jgi:hypothetical protein
MLKRKLHTFKEDRTYVQVPNSPQSTIPKASFPIPALNPVQTPVLLIWGWVSPEKQRSQRETEY